MKLFLIDTIRFGAIWFLGRYDDRLTWWQALVLIGISAAALMVYTNLISGRSWSDLSPPRVPRS